MNREDLQKLTELRVKEATVLYDNGYFDGAYYLLGYAVECALKACIAKQTQQYDFPDKKLVEESYTHDLTKLLKLAKLSEKLNTLDDKSIKINWFTVTNTITTKDNKETVGSIAWSEGVRYVYGITPEQAKSFFDAITDSETGILKWLEKYW
jgi:HEPN domain-containing protein